MSLNLINCWNFSKICLITDDLGEEKRGILITPAIDANEEIINQLISYSGGIIFVALSEDRATKFQLDPMLQERNGNKLSVIDDKRWTISVEAREGVSTGISVKDRTKTINILGEAVPQRSKLVSPGHIFPIICSNGGVLVRSSLPEAALDCVQIGNFGDAAVFIDLISPSTGEFLSLSEQKKLSSQNKIPHFNLSDIITSRLQNEKLVSRVVEARLPTKIAGEMTSVIYRSELFEGEHIALIKGPFPPINPVLTRVQAENTFDDLFTGSCSSSRTSIDESLRLIGDKGSGIFVYLRRPQGGELSQQIIHRGTNNIYSPAHTMRQYGVGAQILRDLGAREVHLLSNTPKTISGLSAFDIQITKVIPLSHSANGAKI